MPLPLIRTLPTSYAHPITFMFPSPIQMSHLPIVAHASELAHSETSLACSVRRNPPIVFELA